MRWLQKTWFERFAHFALDYDSKFGKLFSNCAITLKDTWEKKAQKG
jgi:hypothetical protein